MSDTTPDNDDQPQEGMVKKVRRVKKRRRTSSKKGAQLLREMHQPDEETGGAVTIAQQLERLKQSKEDKRPLDDIWGTKKRSAKWLWTGLLAVILPLTSFGVYFFINENKKKQHLVKQLEMNEQQQREVNEATKLTILEDTIDESTPLGWLQKNSHLALKEGLALLNKINAAQSENDILDSLRSSKNRDLHPVKLSEWGSPPLTKELQSIAWEITSSIEPGSSINTAVPVFVINCRREDRSLMSAYFVRENDELKLDWEATLGLSEVSLADLSEGDAEGNQLIRCVIEKRPNMNTTVDGKKQSGYVLLAPESSDFVFAYIPTEDPLSKRHDEAIKKHLNYGRLIGEIKQNSKVTLRVRKMPHQGDQTYIEIVSFEHAGWVTP